MNEPQSAGALRLTIELVPRTCWHNNLRQALSSAEWDRLRRHVYAQFGHRCAICGAGGRLHCHEVWDYDDSAHVQALRGLLALCEDCHHVKHIGLAGVLASEGKLDYERIVAHFLRVNGCDRETFRRHYEAAMAQWAERSRYEWLPDVRGLTGSGAREQP
jgi:hypothetical protein